MSKDFPEMEYKPIAEEQIELAPHEDAMEFCDKVMRSPRQPMQRRMNAAKERAQYRYPKLGAIATTTMNADTFAEMLDRAISRSQVRLRCQLTALRARAPRQIDGSGANRQHRQRLHGCCR
jgi:hypothetical protein